MALRRGVVIPFIALGLLVLLVLGALPAAAQAVPPEGERMLPYLATWLLPLGIAFLAVGVSHPSRAHHVASALPLAMALAVVTYYLCGFALQFGGVGLVSDHPDLARLLAEWSPLDLRLGPGWGLIGLRGFLLSEDVVQGEGLWLFISQLALVTTAAPPRFAAIHDRVPLVLAEADWDRWLDPESPAPAELLAAPAALDSLTAREVSTLVNSTANNGPDLIAPAGPGDQPVGLF